MEYVDVPKRESGYDSAEDTRRHIERVQELSRRLANKLLTQVKSHDDSKLKSPEKEYFDEYTPKLKHCTYGSEEYQQYLRELSQALKHHYTCNRHHPEHFADGLRGMTLVDLLEMLADWKASSERHEDGDIIRSIEIGQKRFGYDDILKQILKNTTKLMS